MTAPTKNFSAPTDAQIDVDSPIDETLLTQIRDSLVHLEEWLGKDYTAAQNHNHDGVNSASLDLSSDIVRNGSFESNSLTGWDSSTFTGGTIAVGTSNALHGNYAAAITSSVLGNGGGSVTTSQFFEVSGSQKKQFRLMVKGSVSGISSKAEVLWFNAAQSQISSDDIYTTTSTPTDTNGRLCVRRISAPALARYCKVKLTGGIPGSGTATGTVYFDGIVVENPAMLGEIYAAAGHAHTFNSAFGDIEVEIRWGEKLVISQEVAYGDITIGSSVGVSGVKVTGFVDGSVLEVYDNGAGFSGATGGSVINANGASFGTDASKVRTIIRW